MASQMVNTISNRPHMFVVMGEDRMNAIMTGQKTRIRLKCGHTLGLFFLLRYLIFSLRKSLTVTPFDMNKQRPITLRQLYL